MTKKNNKESRIKLKSELNYIDAEATLKFIILDGLSSVSSPEKQVDMIASNLFRPETLWCIKMLLEKHSI